MLILHYTVECAFYVQIHVTFEVTYFMALHNFGTPTFSFSFTLLGLTLGFWDATFCVQLQVTYFYNTSFQDPNFVLLQVTFEDTHFMALPFTT